MTVPEADGPPAGPGPASPAPWWTVTGDHAGGPGGRVFQFSCVRCRCVGCALHRGAPPAGPTGGGLPGLRLRGAFVYNHRPTRAVPRPPAGLPGLRQRVLRLTRCRVFVLRSEPASTARCPLPPCPALRVFRGRGTFGLGSLEDVMFAPGHWCKGTPSASRQEEGAARASSPGAQRPRAEGSAEGGLAPWATGPASEPREPQEPREPICRGRSLPLHSWHHQKVKGSDARGKRTNVTRIRDTLSDLVI
ncbi:hypothetical protein VULLAG_LOCUS34 [Vulpes lagopus]